MELEFRLSSLILEVKHRTFYWKVEWSGFCALLFCWIIRHHYSPMAASIVILFRLEWGRWHLLGEPLRNQKGQEHATRAGLWHWTLALFQKETLLVAEAPQQLVCKSFSLIWCQLVMKFSHLGEIFIKFIFMFKITRVCPSYLFWN